MQADDYYEVVMIGKDEMKASEFKAKCLAVLDEVRDSGREVTITKRGKPVAKVVPVEEADSLRGSAKILVSDEEFIAPLDEPWDVERD
ncbi:type II toxin-antitoxin system Phd/YefM family antitoxin [soil metagenome]